LRGQAEPVYKAIVPLDGGPAPEVGYRVTLVPTDADAAPVLDLVVTDVAFQPFPGRWPAPHAEVEVTAVPAEPTAGQWARLAAAERDLFVRLSVPPVRVGPHMYEVGLPADDQPATLRRGFVEELAVPAQSFLDHADDLMAAHPLRLVQMETVPAVERAEDPEPGTVDATLFGRDFWVTVPADLPDHELVLMLFSSEWPGMVVHLPLVGRPGSVT
jgi:hypothetical protein